MFVKYIAAPVIGAAIGYCTNFIAVKMLFHPRKEIRVFGKRLPFTPGAIPKGKPRLAKSVGNAVGNNLITQADIENKLMSDELAEKIADAVLEKLSLSAGDLFAGLSDSPEEIESKKSAVSASVARFIAEAVSKVDISAVLVEKAPDIIKEKLNNPMVAMFLTDDLLQAVLTPVGAEIQTYIAERGEEFIAPYVSQKLSDSGDKTLAEIAEGFGIDREQLRSAVISLYKKAVSGSAEKLMSLLDLSGIVEDKINAMSAEELETLVMSVMKKELNTIVNLGGLIGLILGLLNLLFLN